VSTATVKRRAAVGLGAAAATTIAPFLTSLPPAVANHNGCQTTHACYWDTIASTQWSSPGTVNDIGSRYVATNRAFNHGTSGKGACAYRVANYGDLQVSLAQNQLRSSFSLREIHSLKWVDPSPAGCPD
jgi:hypothetical protein